MESGGQMGELSLPYHSSVQVPAERDVQYFASPAESGPTLPPPAGGRKNSPCLATAKPMRDCCTSASEKPLYFKLPVSSNGLFVYNSPSQLSRLLCKRASFLSFYQTCMWFTIAACLKLQFFLFPNKTILLVK